MTSRNRSAKELAKKNWAEFLKSKDHYPVLGYPLQFHPNPKEIVDNTVYLCYQTEEDGLPGMAIHHIVEIKRAAGIKDKYIKKQVFVIPRTYYLIADLKKRLRDLPVTVLSNLQEAINLNQQGITIQNPPTSQRNAEGTGRSNRWKSDLDATKPLKLNNVHHMTLNRSNWWVNGAGDKEFRDQHKSKLVTMVNCAGYGGKDDIWANFFLDSHDGPTLIINESKNIRYEYDYRQHDCIIVTDTLELNNLLYKCQTNQRYETVQGRQPCSKNLQEDMLKEPRKGYHPFLYNLSFKLNNKNQIVKSYDIGYNNRCDPLKEKNSDKWRLVTVNTGSIYNGLRLSFVLIAPGILLPSNYTSIPFNTKKEASRHIPHFETGLVNLIIDHTRLGRTMSTIQMQYVPHLDEMDVVNDRLTKKEIQMIEKYSRRS